MARQFRICGAYALNMPHYRVSHAAALLGVSDDTVRRWIDAGRLSIDATPVLHGSTAPSWPHWPRRSPPRPSWAAPVAESARNRFTGLVTRVVKDTVMAQVDLQCGPFRVVSLMSAEAATELRLEPGVLAVASVKSTHVVIEVPEP